MPPGGQRKGIDREDGPGAHKQNEEPEISYEADIPSDGADEQGEAEIRKLPEKPELSPKPDRLEN